jgi:hypothetical protein
LPRPCANVITLTIPNRTSANTRASLAGIVLECSADLGQPPVVVINPQSVSNLNLAGQPFSMSVGTVGSPSLGYQW